MSRWVAFPSALIRFVLVVPVLVGAAAAATGCDADRPVEPSGPATLAFLTGLRGTTEPCGCTSKPLGGLDRLAGVLAGLRGAGPTSLVLTGDTFFEREAPPAHLFEIERRRAGVIADVLPVLRPSAMLLGPVDMGSQADWLKGIGSAHSLPLLRRPKVGAPLHARMDNKVLRLGDVSVGIVGVPGEAAGEEEAYGIAADAMRAQGADVVVALVPYGGDAGFLFARKLRGVSVAILGGASGQGEVRVVGGTLAVEAGDKGRYLGLMRFLLRKPDARREWVFDDEGAGEKRALEKRIAGLRDGLAELADGGAKTARQAKVAELEQQLITLRPTPPPGNAITVSFRPIHKDDAPDPAVRSQLAVFARDLCKLSEQSTTDRICTPAAKPGEGYVGTAECATCHDAAFAHWKKTKHAVAWATLERDGKMCDLGCISCHTVGYEKAGGFCRLRDAAAWRDVGCESCHGPGAAHAAAPEDVRARSAPFSRGRDEVVCRECHTPEHSDLFDFETYLPKILGPGHGAPPG